MRNHRIMCRKKRETPPYVYNGVTENPLKQSRDYSVKIYVLMKKIILGVTSILFVSVLFFQCSKEPVVSEVEEIELRTDIEDIGDIALVKCQKGTAKCANINMVGISPSSLEGLTPSAFLRTIGWPAAKNLCKGDCTPGVACLPTSIESTSSSKLVFETDNDTGTITGVTNNSTNATIKVCIAADSCDC